MTELDDFLATTLARQIEAEQAIHNGDPAPRLVMWSSKDPLTLFGAGTTSADRMMCAGSSAGWGRGSRTAPSYRFELVAAGVSGDLAYTVGYEHTAVSLDGAPVQPYTLRVTHVYGREGGEWRIVHRHGDSPPTDQSSPAQASTQ